MKRFLNAFILNMVAAFTLVFAFAFLASAIYFTYMLVFGEVVLNEVRANILVMFYGCAFLFLYIWVLMGIANYKYNI